MKNLRILALLLLSAAIVSPVMFAKKNSDDMMTTNSKNGRKSKKMTKSEKEAERNEQWVEGNDEAVVDPSEIRYEGNRQGSAKGRHGSYCKKEKCGTCSTQPCGKPPVCRKLVPVETCAEKHEHKTYSYTCPVGYTELPPR